MRLIILLLALIICSNLFADEPRYSRRFANSDSTFYIEYNNKDKWILKNLHGDSLYQIDNENFTSMTIKVSDDGNKLVVIDDFAEYYDVKDRKVLWFFNSGKLMKSYLLTDLVEDTCNLSQSVWHLDWIVGDIGDVEDSFEFSTNEFYSFKFNPINGQLISKRRPDSFTDSSLIVYGKFRQRKGQVIKMHVYRCIYGNKKRGDIVEFKTDKFGDNVEWTGVILIKDGVDVTPRKFRQFITYNKCY